jgi:hypothetical protein
MKQSIKVRQKRPGRPATGRDPSITVRIPAEILRQSDLWASAIGVGRSEAIRRLVELGLKKGK